MYFKLSGKASCVVLLRKTLLVMKLIAFLIVIAILFVCSPALSQRASITGKDLPLEQVFMEIRKQTGLEFVYESALLKTSHSVTLDVQQMPVDEVLKFCLKGQGLGFNIRGGTVIIFKLDEPVQTSAAGMDQVIIKGRVVDALGLPVEMASVVLVRTNIGTQTDRSGSFTLKVKNRLAADSLNISFIGLKSYSFKPNNITDVGDIVLLPADNVLDETVIRAYGTTSERLRTGNISMVKAADIEKMPALNVVEALAGRVAGLNVWQSGALPGSVYNIQLRGVNIIPPDVNSIPNTSHLIYLLSKPLIVVDGLPMAPDLVSNTFDNIGVDAITAMYGAGGGQDPLYWLNPLDIESISVLKDADASALYGSRAANGVIIISSKNGRPNKTTLHITVNTGVNVQAKRLKLFNTQQYLAMRREAWDNTIRAGLPVSGVTGTSYRPDTLNSYDLMVWDTTRYTDWQDVLLGSAPNSNAHVELSGGKRRTTFRLAAGYNNSRTSYPRFPGKNIFREERSTVSMHFSTRSHNNRFRWVTSASGASTYSFQPYQNAYNYIFLAPNAPAMLNDTGKLNYAEWHTGASGTSLLTGNPMELMRNSYRGNRFSMQAASNLSYEIWRSLLFSINAGLTASNSRQIIISPAITSNPVSLSAVNSATFGNSTGNGFTIEPGLRYENSLARHHFVLQGGGSFQRDRQNGEITTGRGYTLEQLGNQAGATSYITVSDAIERRSLSLWGRVSYQYAGKYLTDLSVRRDGSSSFGPGRRFGNFGSAGLGWIFTEEHWGKHIPLLTFGKIRGSYGITGIQNTNLFTYYTSFTPARLTGFVVPTLLNGFSSNGVYNGVNTLALTQVANPNFAWAQANSSDVGADLYFLADQRLKLTVQWYRKIIGNQFAYSPVSSVTGNMGLFVENTTARVENKGTEIMIDYRSPLRKSGINWEVHFNIATNRNKLVAYPGLENLYVGRYFEVGQSLIRQQLYPSYLNTKLDLYQYTDSAHPAALPYFVDNTPSYTGGLQAGISWKGLALSVSCVYAKQKGFTNVQGAGLPGNLSATGIGNQPVSVIPQNEPGRAFYAGLASNNLIMDIYWGDASYLAIKNASLSYRLPQTLLHKWRSGGVSFYLNAENLLLITRNYKGVNPEQANLTTSQMPLRKILVAGFTINI